MLAVANVALRRFLRERSNLFFVFVLPFLIIFLVGYSAGSGASAPLAVVGAETELGAAVLEHLDADSFVRFTELDDALDAVGETSAAGVVIFPEDPTGSIEFRSRTGVGLDARAELDAAIAAENQQLVIERQALLVGVGPDEIAAARSASEPVPVITETSGQIVWGGLANIDAAALTQVILFMFLSALTASSFLVQDRDLGMATRKASAPISVRRLVAGETLGRLWIALFQAVLIVSVTGLLFDVGWGDPLATGAVLLLFGLVSTGTGILLGTASNNPEGANGAGVMIGLVLAALGGAMAPVEIFPSSMQDVARLTPHFWAIDGLQTSLTGGGVADIGGPVAVLVVYAAGILAISTVLYRRRAFG